MEYTSPGRIIYLKRKDGDGCFMIKEVLKEWNLQDSPVQIHPTAWSVNDDYVIKEYSDRNALLRNIEMFKILHKEGIPVPVLCPLPGGKEFYEKHDKMYLLTSKIKGNSIVNISQCDEAWFFQFGTILAKLHLTFRKCEVTLRVWNNSLLEEMKGWVSANLKKFSPEYISGDEIEKAIMQLSQDYQDLPKQLIHRDVHLGNFLFEGKDFTGYIDFDLSQSNIRIFDLCYFLLGILVEEDNYRVNVEHWYIVIRQVLDGYHSLAELEQIEKLSIPCVMKNIELLFTAYFLSIGDERLAKASADLFYFVCRNEEGILDAIIK